MSRWAKEQQGRFGHHSGLSTDDCSCFDRHLRLVVQHQLTTLDGMAEFGLHRGWRRETLVCMAAE